MYNADVFEYELDVPMTLYGSIPFMQAHRKDSTVGVFWLNSAETWVDIVKIKQTSNPLGLGMGNKKDTQTHWISESGLLDAFIFMGPSPKEIIKAYGELTGYTQLPQQFAIGYHQCRWNYVSDEDVKDVDRKFDKYNIHYDVIWLDIDHPVRNRYCRWHHLNFRKAVAIVKDLNQNHPTLVVIIDPHILNLPHYNSHVQLKRRDLAVKNNDGNISDQWCCDVPP